MIGKRLEELRRVHSEIRDLRNRNDVEMMQKGETILWDSVKKIVELNKLARLEGLLALEEAVMEIPDDSELEVLKQLVIMVVDGTDPDILEGIGLTRYYAHLYEGYEALRYLIYLEGVLSIQAGENPIVLEEKLKVMLPKNMYLQYSLEQEQKRQEKEREEKEHLIENLCKGERQWNSKDNGYYVYKLLDYVICDITDKDLQRVMREIDNLDLTIAMRGMSGEARKHVFANMSKRLGMMIAEDMVHMGSVRAIDILEASQKILGVLIYLIEKGEIAQRYEYLEPFYQVFSVDTNNQQLKNSKIFQLKQLVEEYEHGEMMVKEVEEEE